MKDQIYGKENTGLSKCDNVSLISSKLGWGSSIFASKMNKPLQGKAPTWTPSNGMCFHKCSLMCFLGCFLLGALLSSLLSALFSAFLCTCTYIELLWMHRISFKLSFKLSFYFFLKLSFRFTLGHL